MAISEDRVTKESVRRDAPDLEALRAEARRQTDQLRQEFSHELDQPYGNHPRQRIDLYLPNQPPVGPVLVFLHGGGFRGGDHASVAYHGRPYLAKGAIFATMGYRLVPDAKFPDMCDDVEAGLNWLESEVAARGGDPDRVHLSGHSAGATLAAMAAMRPRDQRSPDLVKGLVVISGMYDYASRNGDDTDRTSPRYVPDLSSAIERLPSHTIVVHSDHDLSFAAPDANALVSSLREKGASVEQFVEPNADHYQANRSFVDPSGVVAQAVTKMMGLDS